MKTGILRSRILIILVLGTLIGLSLWFGFAAASTESFHHKDVAYLENKKNNAKALSASASGVSVLVSLLPEDTAAPLANQISDISRDFMIVLSALAAEQQLLTIAGRIAFCWIIPIALGIIILFVLLRRKLFLQIGVKLLIGGCVLYMLVPVTLRITRLADSSYEEVVDTSLQQSREIEDTFHYNENGVVMPGMSDGTAVPETETASEAQTKDQTEARTEVQTEARTEVQTEARTEVQTEARTEVQTEAHTEVQTEARTEVQTEECTEVQTEAGKQGSKDKQESKPKKQKKKKLSWHERLWNHINGFFSADEDASSQISEEAVQDEARKEVQSGDKTEARSELQTEAGKQASKDKQKSNPKKKPKKKLPWYERLWNDISVIFSNAAGVVSRISGKIAVAVSQVSGIVVESASQVPEIVVESASQVPGMVVDTATNVAGTVSDTAVNVAGTVSDTAAVAVDKVIEAGENAGAMASMLPQVPQMAADLLNNLIDAFVLMIVTTCVLPIAVLIGMLWLSNQILNINPDWEKQKP